MGAGAGAGVAPQSDLEEEVRGVLNQHLAPHHVFKVGCSKTKTHTCLAAWYERLEGRNSFSPLAISSSSSRSRVFVCTFLCSSEDIDLMVDLKTIAKLFSAFPSVSLPSQQAGCAVVDPDCSPDGHHWMAVLVKVKREMGEGGDPSYQGDAPCPAVQLATLPLATVWRT